MTAHINSETVLSSPQKIPLVECRPHFEAALSRINDSKIEHQSDEKAKLLVSDSFGTWLEWD